MTSEKIYTQKVSLSHRKKFAQFFTPETIAKIMIDWLLCKEKLMTVLEPAFGLGVFSRLLLKKNKNIQIKGFDVDPVIFDTAKQNFGEFSNVQLFLEDYLFNDWENKYDGIICNPPYFKFHDYENKKSLVEIKSKLNINLNGFTNIYTLFLLKSIYQLNENGRAAYIIPSEFLNSDYGKLVKYYLLKSNTLRHIIIFNFTEKVFDDALTTSAIILLAKDKNYNKIHFTTIKNREQLEKLKYIVKNYPDINADISINKEDIKPSVKWRIYYQKQESLKYKNLIPFNSVAKVVRGIATGSNDYFTFNLTKVKKYNIPEEYLLPCISKSKDVISPFFTKQDFEKLKNNNANIFLLNTYKNPSYKSVLDYIKLGEQDNIHKKYLTSKRNPWYILENRPPSPIWVGVFNRTGIKFIRNEIGISNLTTFHCVYPVSNLFSNIEIDLLFAYLLIDIAKDIFNDNRREYGDGLKKFEPNDLNNALMLDLSKLDKISEGKILNLYQEYRTSIINNQENKVYIKEINEIFKEKYAA